MKNKCKQLGTNQEEGFFFFFIPMTFKETLISIQEIKFYL